MLIISATNRPNSNTEIIANYYKNLLNEQGQDSEIFSLSSLPSNLMDIYYTRPHADFDAVQQLIYKHNKFVFVIPEYNGSFPGLLKLFMDACKFPESFSGKKAALVGIASGKYGNIRGVEHFTGICNYAGMAVLPQRMHVPLIHKMMNEAKEVIDEDTIKFLKQQSGAFIKF